MDPGPIPGTLDTIEGNIPCMEHQSFAGHITDIFLN